jgi:hypothetical protein
MDRDSIEHEQATHRHGRMNRQRPEPAGVTLVG